MDHFDNKSAGLDERRKRREERLLHDALNDPWSAVIETHSRDTAIKISTLIAKAIDKDRLTTDNTRIFILGGNGKSLIVDAIAMHLSDHHSAYKMPSKRFVEGKASKALGKKWARKIVKPITHQGENLAITFTHLSGQHHLSWKDRQLSKIFKSRNVGIHFQTEIDEGFNDDFMPHISIRYKPIGDANHKHHWDRQWIIRVKDDRLKTPKMQEILSHLRDVEHYRQTRIFNSQQSSDELYAQTLS